MMDKQKLQEIIEAHDKWLRGEDGVRANLCGADLHEVNLQGANLREARLCGANLHEANLREANLYDANLCWANLYDADLRGANLCWADLRGAKLPERIVQAGPFGSYKDYILYWIDRDFVQCGYWNKHHGGSLDEFKRYIDEVYPEGRYRQEYLAAIAMFDALKS